MSYKVRNMPYRSPAPDVRLGLAVVECQHGRCQQGEHDVTIVPADRLVYASGGRRRAVGERYCRCCGERLAAGPVKSPRTCRGGALRRQRPAVCRPAVVAAPALLHGRVRVVGAVRVRSAASSKSYAIADRDRSPQVKRVIRHGLLEQVRLTAPACE